MCFFIFKKQKDEMENYIMLKIKCLRSDNRGDMTIQRVMCRQWDQIDQEDFLKSKIK